MFETVMLMAFSTITLIMMVRRAKVSRKHLLVTCSAHKSPLKDILGDLAAES